MLHGCTQHPDDFAAGTQMNQLAREHGFLVLYPAQTQHANSSKCWNWFKPQHQQRERGEPALLAALTQSVMARARRRPGARLRRRPVGRAVRWRTSSGARTRTSSRRSACTRGCRPARRSDLMSALAAMKKRPRRGARAGRPPMPPTIVFHGDADSTVQPRNGEQVVAAALAGAATAAAPPAQESSGQSPQRPHLHPPHLRERRGRGGGRALAAARRRTCLGRRQSSGLVHRPLGPDASAEMLRFFLSPPAATLPAHAS